MRRLSIAAFGLLTVARAVPQPVPHLGAWRWERAIVPPAASAQAEQCVVLDPELFARSAPGLRDVRLVQDGREIPFATDESFDDRQADAAAPPPSDDRALFDHVATIPLTPSPSPTRAADFVLPAQVPVERIRLVAPGTRSDAQAMQVDVTAQPRPATGISPTPEPERVHLEATPVRLAMPVTLGANLQTDAAVQVRVQHAAEQVQAVVFEMRRRELCYQPLSSGPLSLLFGNAAARPVRYDYATHYHPSATPLLATMGPVLMNPAYRPPLRQSFTLTRTQRLALACGVAAAGFLLTALPLLRLRSRR